MMGFWICMGIFAFAIGFSLYMPIRNRRLANERWARWKAFQARVFPQADKKDKA